MDAERPPARASSSLSTRRAAAVLIGFVVAVAVLVSWGTRPSVSTTVVPTTVTTVAPTTPTTAAAAGGAATTTTAAPTTTTAAHGHKGGATTTTTTVPHSSVSVIVANATNTSGLAAHYTAVIGAAGWAMKTPTDATTSEATSAVYYSAGFEQQAQEIATTIGVKPTAVAPLTAAVPVSAVTGTDVVVVIGQDLAATTTATTAG